MTLRFVNCRPAKAAENIQTEVNRELRRLTNIMGRFAEIVVGAVMKGFNWANAGWAALLLHAGPGHGAAL